MNSYIYEVLLFDECLIISLLDFYELFMNKFNEFLWIVYEYYYEFYLWIIYK